MPIPTKFNGKSFFLAVVALLILSGSIQAQVDTIRFDKHYLKKYWTDAKTIASSPVRWKGDDWLKLGAFMVVETGLSLADQPIRDFVQEHKSTQLDGVSKNFLEPFGGNYSAVLMSGFLVHGLVSGNKKSVSTGLLTIESFLLASATARIPKILAGRVRPDRASSPYEFKGIFNGTSFPSGHTTAVFSVASVVATQYRSTKWVPVVSYSVASLVGLSRVYDNKHWITDVVAGAAIGTLVGNMVSRRVPNSRLTWMPMFDQHVQGIHLAYRL